MAIVGNDLVKEVASHLKVDDSTVRKILEGLAEVVSAAASEGKVFEIPGLGLFGETEQEIETAITQIEKSGTSTKKAAKETKSLEDELAAASGRRRSAKPKGKAPSKKAPVPTKAARRVAKRPVRAEKAPAAPAKKAAGKRVAKKVAPKSR